MHNRRILVAPLNWGLGHATRCIPIIESLLVQKLVPVIASDGEALELLKKEFPKLEFYNLPSYKIRYPNKGFYFRIKLLLQTPHILKTISAEKKLTERLVEELKLDGIISDNRWGMISSRVPSVFITHQVNVISGFTTWITSRIQQNYIKKFDECWIPDYEDFPNLSGKMGHGNNFPFKVKYIGLFSRLEKLPLPFQYDLLVLLSGPEPQRGLLEIKLMEELQEYAGSILFVEGIIEKEQRIKKVGNFTFYNFLTTAELQKILNSSRIVICRPGYTSLMDLAKLGIKAFLIPTPGQYEQEYLAKRLLKDGIAGSCSQKEFKAEKLKETADYKGLGIFNYTSGFTGTFTLFKGK